MTPLPNAESPDIRSEPATNTHSPVDIADKGNHKQPSAGDTSGRNPMKLGIIPRRNQARDHSVTPIVGSREPETSEGERSEIGHEY